MSLKIALLFIKLVICFHNVQSKGVYTIVAPGTLRSESAYQVSISLSDFRQPCLFKISIEFNQTTKPQNEITEMVEVHPGTTKLVQIQIPQLDCCFGKLKVNGARGIISRDVARIFIEDLHYTVYIQTDKSKYKPGELMQFRVICIDRLTRPAKVNENIEILIYDGQGNLIKKNTNVKLIQGVYKGDLQISEYPVLGNWAIEVMADGHSMQTMPFEVAEYVLPIFSVDIITKKDVPLSDGQIALNIKSRYTYGEPVKGNLTVNLHTKYPASSNSKPRTKQSQTNGETTVIFDFNNDLNIPRKSSNDSVILYKFNIEARVQDALSSLHSDTKIEVTIHNNPYKITVNAPKMFEPEELVNIAVSVTDLEGNPIRDQKNPVKVTFEEIHFDADTIKTVNTNLDERGIAVALVNLTGDSCKVSAEYLGWSSFEELIEKNANAFNLDILTEKPEVGKELLIQLKCKESIGYFDYEIISRGEIIQSDHINVPRNESTFTLRINVTHNMVPKVTLYVHRTTGSILDTRLKEVYIRRTFQNSITIDADEEVLPGALVSVNVTTNPGSYVGLLGVDKRILLDAGNHNHLTEEHFFTDLRNYDSLNMNVDPFPGRTAGLVTFSNAVTREGFNIGDGIVFHGLDGEEEVQEAERFDKPSVELARVRKLFSESWLFKDFESTPAEGLRLRDKIPDTITSWTLTGFSLNPKTGLSLTKNHTTVKVFQRFFISMDLPSLIRKGETIEIPVYVFNYMDQDISSDITISSKNSGLELLDTLNSEAKNQSSKTVSKTIPAQGNVKLLFLARFSRSRRYNILVKAISPVASDAVEKTLNVAPEGVPYSFSKTYLVHFPTETEQEDTFSLDIPDNAVRGSENIQLSVVGDIFGPLTKSLQKLVRVPYGNGEENIRYFVSNLLVLKYLKTVNHSNPSLETKAKLHLELGYQSHLAFKHLDGSFSFFHRTVGYTGDVWLTAYSLWGLQQAKDFITVDQKVIDRGLNYLKSKQGENGCVSSGKGRDEDVALTAFTMMSFLVDEINEWKYNEVITKGLEYLHKVLDTMEASITSVMSTYALVLGKHEKSAELLSKLSSSASLLSKRIVWSKLDNLQSNLETTASGFVNLFESQKNPMESLLPIVRALVATSGSQNIPTQIIALEAMIGFVRDMDIGTRALKINFSDNQGVSGDLQVNSSNAQVLQTTMLSKSTRDVHLKTKGSGFAIVKIRYTYNMLSESQSSKYQTNINVQDSDDIILAFEMCIATGAPSNITAIEVNLQSGYRFDGKSFDEFQRINAQVRSIQFNGNQGSVLVYVQDISQKPTCLRLVGVKSYSVFNAKQGSVIVYDVHKEDEKSISFFGRSPTKS